jgi:hypothetical protein
MSKALPAALIALLAGLALPAQAQVHRCTQPDGSVTFQSAPCGTDVAPREGRLSAAQLNAAKRAQERAREQALERAAAASQARGASSQAHAAGPQKAASAAPCRRTPGSASAPARSASCR